MGRITAKSFFLAVVAVFAAAIVLAVREVPQPLRGYLVGWLLFAGSLGVLTLRFLRHYYRYKVERLHMRPNKPKSQAGRSRSRRHRAPTVEIVFSDSAGAGRYTIR